MTGWRQPPVPRPRPRPKCPHIGLIGAALTISQHLEGHEWVCSCGQVFRVVSDGGRNKRLVEVKS